METITSKFSSAFWYILKFFSDSPKQGIFKRQKVTEEDLDDCIAEIITQYENKTKNSREKLMGLTQAILELINRSETYSFTLKFSNIINQFDGTNFIEFYGNHDSHLFLEQHAEEILNYLKEKLGSNYEIKLDTVMGNFEFGPVKKAKFPEC